MVLPQEYSLCQKLDSKHPEVSPEKEDIVLLMPVWRGLLVPGQRFMMTEKKRIWSGVVLVSRIFSSSCNSPISGMRCLGHKFRPMLKPDVYVGMNKARGFLLPCKTSQIWFVAHNGEMDMVWADISGSNELALSFDIGVDDPTSGCQNSWRNTDFQCTIARGTFRV